MESRDSNILQLHLSPPTTTHPGKMIEKLTGLGVVPPTCNWILDLSD